MHRFAHGLFLLRADVVGAEHIGAHGKADEDVHQQVDQGTGASHRGEGLVPGEPSCHNDVRGVEKKLQDAGKHERDGKAEQLSGQRPVAHVDFIGLCFHDSEGSSLLYDLMRRLCDFT